ncbi:interferon regulatory factor 1-like [Hyla sarda]|uniref:interferon regulatory factor 1-like n=1 Tax=Hyla sarda TaxID=327740 RepID=UPI0024C30A83|nr:interferon regulatory factor 1-like [Hyla sarda]XP_056431032.1 interferon regulatory factor 1-like [Hyla sarda]
MPVTRLRMRPWLEMQIASKKIPGLSWIDEKEGVFQIPWKHAARHGWDIEKDACLFRSWAMHTGKFKVGEKEPDPKTWKANFRCAMNSLPDIKEVKDKSIHKGSSAIRVYRMLPAQVKTDKKERKSKSLKDSKNRPKKQTDSSSIDSELEEAVKNCQLPDDHNSYTANYYSAPEIDITNTEILAMNECEVSSSMSEWEDPVDVPLPDSTNDMYPLQVSPMGSEADDEETTAEELYKLLEPIVWQQTNVDGKGYYTNEFGTQNSLLQECSLYDSYRLSEIVTNSVRVTTEMKPRCDFSLHELTSAITC